MIGVKVTVWEVGQPCLPLSELALLILPTEAGDRVGRVGWAN